MMKPKITFLMLAYNAEDYIERAVYSILNQTEKNIVLYIRNNGSTDNTLKIIGDIAKKDNRVHAVSNKVNGICDDGSTFLMPLPTDERDKGEYYSIVDSDDFIAPNFAEVMYQKAKEQKADLTVCGNYFVDENGNPLGKRTTSTKVYSKMQDIGEDYPKIYNCFRTWWAKLYRTEFFEKHIEAWEPYRPMWWFFDTVMTINYLKVCKTLVCIEKPLYFVVERKNSMYRSRKMDGGRLLEADALYNNNLDFINTHNLCSTSNLHFNYMTHWTYLKESLAYLLNPDIDSCYTLKWLNAVANDKIVEEYNEFIFRDILEEFNKYLNIVRNSQDNSIYFNYLMRINYFLELYSQDKSSYLCLPILMGCISDPNNRSYFGKQLFNLSFEQTTEGFNKAKQFNNRMWEWWYLNPEDFIHCINSLDRDEQIIEMENKLQKYMDDMLLEEAADLMDTIAKKCPFSKVALINRVLLCIYIKEIELAVVLVATLKNIWKDDFKIKQLYDYVYEMVYVGQEEA